MRAGGTTLYFTLAIAITWLALLPATLAAWGLLPGPPDAYMAAAPLAIFGPTIAAVIAAHREGGRPAIRALFARFRRWRVSPIWYLVAIALPGLVYAGARAIHGLVAEDGGPFTYFPTQPEHVAAMILVPIGEEIGWRGFALPRLIERHGPRRATAILGVIWGLWHLPMFVGSGTSGSQTLVSMAVIVAGTPLFTWLFRHTGGSLLLAVLLHVGLHLDNPMRAGDVESSIPLYLMLGGHAALAVVLLLGDRRAFADDRAAIVPAGEAPP